MACYSKGYGVEIMPIYLWQKCHRKYKRPDGEKIIAKRDPPGHVQPGELAPGVCLQRCGVHYRVEIGTSRSEIADVHRLYPDKPY